MGIDEKQIVFSQNVKKKKKKRKEKEKKRQKSWKNIEKMRKDIKNNKQKNI